MKFGKCSAAKLYAGESLSSWCYRLSQFSDVQQYLLDNFCDPDRETFYFRSVFEFHEKLSPSLDLDIVEASQQSAMLKSIIGDSLEFFFRPEGHAAPIIPWIYRRSYCELCVAEAMRVTKAPILKFTWRKVLAPFCSRHSVLLRDSPPYVSSSLDAPLSIFKWHFTKHNRSLRHEDYVARWGDLLKISFSVQERITALREVNGSSDVWLIDNVLMSLMRALLRPRIFTYNHAGSKLLIEIQSKGYETPYIRYHLQVFRASTACRARALFYIGVLLGWVNSEVAQSALKDDYWAPNSPGAIWDALIQFDRDLSRLLRDSLRRFGTPALHISSGFLS